MDYHLLAVVDKAIVSNESALFCLDVEAVFLVVRGASCGFRRKRQADDPEGSQPRGLVISVICTASG